MIKLKKITADDTPLILKMRNADEVKQNFVIHDDFTEESQLNWLENTVGAGKAIQYIILFDDVPVGSVYINNIDHVHAKGELGIFIGDTTFRGQSIGITAINTITCIAFEELTLHRVYLRVFPENVTAVRSYEKAGFLYEGLLRDTVYTGGRYRDMIVMSKINKTLSSPRGGGGGGG
ncbi:MAG: GNAT family N-acetyltransferase, partial [Synergistaceae bacterium]|nr:GNAT family N-acetyltransferase [Synergistaceae bacterium]